MKNYKTIIVSCFIQDSPQAIPLAASMLKSYAQNINGLETNLQNFTINDNTEEAAKNILSENPDSVGFSMYIWNRFFFEEVAKRLKAIDPGIIIYCGGAEVTASWKSLSLNNHFDYFIRGEGEIPFSRLMDFLIDNSRESVDRLMKQDHLQNLNAIPSPFLEGILYPSEWDGILWELSRGCPFNCSFCAESRGIAGVRYFEEERIEAELKFFENNQVDQIFVLDPTFNVKADRALKIISLIKEHAPFIHFTFEIRAELLTEELAQAFSEIHCSLQIGLQSAHHEVLKKLNRNINRDDFLEKINLLNQYGAVFGLDLIYGLPGDSKTGFFESLDYALYCIPNHLDIFRLSVFPGTDLYEKSTELKMSFQDKPPYQVLDTPDFNSDDLVFSEQIAISVDYFYNRGRSAPWLLSVTEFLNLKPSVFFKEFSKFLGKKKNSGEEIFEIQISYLQDLFRGENHDGLACSIDQVLFHHLYAEALQAKPLLQNEERFPIDMEAVYHLNTTLKQGIFSFDVTLYSESGMIDIDLFLQQYSKSVSYGLIFNNGYEILTMEVEQHLYQFVTAIDGKNTMAQILSLINTEADEMQDFIGFLVESELIIRAV